MAWKAILAALVAAAVVIGLMLPTPHRRLSIPNVEPRSQIAQIEVAR